MPQSSPRPVPSDADLFGRLGKAARPSAPSADATGELDELGADDILEVSELGSFEDVQVEGAAAPVKTSAGIPAPKTSPVLLESPTPDETVVTRMDFRNETPMPTPAPAPADATQQMTDTSKVAKAVEALDAKDDGPGQTEVLVRATMPSALQSPTPPPTSVHTPTAPHAAPPAGWQKGSVARPSSIPPMAFDVGRGTMPSLAIPPPPALPRFTPGSSGARPNPRKGQNTGLLIGMIAGGALLLFGMVGTGAFVASRALSSRGQAAAATGNDERSASVAAAPPVEAAPAVSPLGESAPSVVSTPTPTPSTPGIDVSSLPAAATPTAAPAQGAHVTSSRAAPALAAPAGNARSAAAPAKGAPASPPSTGAVPPPATSAAATPPPAPTQNREPLPNGVVRVDPSLRVVVVDGAFRRVTDGTLIVSCGRHRIKAGMSERTVDVPCGGALQL